MNVLVVAAHPDDEVLGAGGAIARHVEQGDKVSILILGEGVASREGLSKEKLSEAQEQLRAEAKAAITVLGADEPVMLAMPDNAFDSVPLISIVHEIERMIASVRPELVYTHHVGDVNIDHRLTLDAVLVAARPVANFSVKEVRSFEVASSSEWNFIRTPFRPNVFVGLSGSQLRKKSNAMSAYKSEIRKFPHPRSLEYLEALARVRGGQSGFSSAEAFELVYSRN